jgi:hypothetical protein
MLVTTELSTLDDAVTAGAATAFEDKYDKDGEHNLQYCVHHLQYRVHHCVQA